MQVREDVRARRWWARRYSLGALHEWPSFALLASGVFSLTLLARVLDWRWPHPEGGLMGAALILLTPIPVSVLSWLLYRTLSASWTIGSERLRIRGREIASIRFDRIRRWRVVPIEGLPGYQQIMISARSTHRIVLLVGAESHAVEHALWTLSLIHI